jgi:hypothetical protein
MTSQPETITRAIDAALRKAIDAENRAHHLFRAGDFVTAKSFQMIARSWLDDAIILEQRPTGEGAARLIRELLA